MHVRVSGEELLDPHGLMRRQVVRDNMDLLAARLVGDQIGEEGHKFLAGMPRGGFAQHFAAVGVKRGVQRERPVPIILKAMALQPPWRQRQHRIKPAAS
jgi:hypothetical protein